MKNIYFFLTILMICFTSSEDNSDPQTQETSIFGYDSFETAHENLGVYAYVNSLTNGSLTVSTEYQGI